MIKNVCQRLTVLTAAIVLIICTYSFAQQTELKSYNNFTFYYLDNSDGYDSDAMSTELTEELKTNLSKLKARTDNYFFLYACNGTNYKTQYSLTALTEKGSTFLRQYLARPSKESEYDFDTQALRENLTDNPIRIKQNVEINLYLSSGAIKKMIENAGDLPTPIFFPHELINYLNATNNLRVVLNVYTNKKDTESYGYEKLKQYFVFCNQELNNVVSQTEIYSF